MAKGLAIGRRGRRRQSRNPLLLFVGFIILLGLLSLHKWTFDWIRVVGINMCPTLHQGDVLLINRDQEPQWGDIVLVRAHDGEGLRRVLGLPGETI